MEENEFEEESQEMQPFTLEDAQEDEKACMLCDHRASCPIIVYVNKLSLKRDGKGAEADFSCCLFLETA